MKVNNRHSPEMFTTCDTVTIYRSYPTGVWVVKEDGVEYPVFVVLGGYTWCMLNGTFEVVFESNFQPYTFNVKDHVIQVILSPDNKLLDEYIFVKSSPYINHFVKRRERDGEIEEVGISHHFDYPKYGSGKDGGKRAQERYVHRELHPCHDIITGE